jgi:hypothetical protein
MLIQRGAQKRWEEWFAKSPLQITPPTSHEFCKSPLPPPMSSPLDQDRVTRIEVSIVCMTRWVSIVSTRYIYTARLKCNKVQLVSRLHRSCLPPPVSGPQQKEARAHVPSPTDQPAKQNKKKKTAAHRGLIDCPPDPPGIRLRTWLNLRHSFTWVYNTRYTVVTLGREQKKRKTATSLIASPSPCTSGCRTWRSLQRDGSAFTTHCMPWLQMGERKRERNPDKKTPRGNPRTQSAFRPTLSGQPPRCRRHHCAAPQKLQD